ncbi:MAG TPA: nucleotidyl transferase AbiEii/AbiGii toxin family protein [Candidatus Andersenbacteria bacterium]|nr:nucleotidyl transferase AbiEii/AbiGii toxin family protein [Candidatus Andersenbacteria bacterium]
MIAPLVTDQQRAFLHKLGATGGLANQFYLTGGTALAGFYLRHRHSEDLDFFSEQEIDVPAVTTFLHTIQTDLGVTKIDFQQSFNRNIFFLHAGMNVLKTEFTYYPFPRIEAGSTYAGIAIDSLLDIAVNKLFTIYQQSRARDYIDLFFICQNKNLPIENLVALAQEKFDYYLDPLQLGTQFTKADVVKDYPRMITEVSDQEWQAFFLREAKKLKPKILT